jgi:hypothetical protein
VTVIRGVGAYAVVGNFKDPPFDPLALERALDHGPLTFEAEQLSTGRPDTLATDASASGGAVRQTSPRLWEHAESFALVHGITPRLPVGRYTAKFWMTFHCWRFRGEALGQAAVTARGRKTVRALRCAGSSSTTSAASDAQELTFELTAAAPVDLLLQITQGDVTLDRITLSRAKKPASTATTL